MTVYTQADYQRLCQMIAKGVKEMSINGETVKFHSLDEMIRIKRMIERDMAARAHAKTTTPIYSKG